MKLLLTSGGLRNQTLIDEFLSLFDKPAEEIKVAFIPTALNVEPGDKNWAIMQMLRLRDIGIKQLDIVDVSAVDKATWLPRLEESDCIFVNGGNTTHLMKSCNKSGLTEEVRKLLADRVYVGISAGSYIATPDIRFNTDNVDEVLDGLSLVNFGMQVHLYSPKFASSKTLDAVKERVKGCPYKVYAIDDETAIRVNEDEITIVGEGESIVFEPS